MHNVYLIESDNSLLINDKIQEIIQENKLENPSLITYDMEEVNISFAIQDLDTYSLFKEEKVVYCKNATFLTSCKSDIEHDQDLLLKYLENPNPENILILSCPKADNKKKIVKFLKSNFSCIETRVDLKKYVKDRLQDYKMKTDVMTYFLESTGQDLFRIKNELDKLMELKRGEKEITSSDIDKIVIKKIDNNIFDLIDAIMSKNKAKSLVIYQNMVNYGEDIFRIFIALSNQIRLIYQVKVLRNLSNDDIASMLNLKNPKQVVALRYKIDKYNEKDLLKYLHQLSIMDEELKTGKSIDKVAFPVFIASL